MIRHLVAVRFSTEVAGEVRTRIFADLGELRAHLAGIHDFQFRENTSPEAPVVHGFRDLFWFDFADAAAREAYLDDPAHKAIGARLVAAAGGTDGILVLDFDL